jgi:AraC-like DNA-binding protein
MPRRSLPPATDRRHVRRDVALVRVAAVFRRARRASAVQLARLTGYSPSRLRALVREALGEPPARRLRRRQLDLAACTLLRESTSPTQLARVAGFSSAEAFHRAFRRRFGCTPGALAARRVAPRAPRGIALGLALADHFAHSTETDDA